MDIYRLSKDELEYELRVRCVQGVEACSVAHMRTLLRRLLSIEKEGQLGIPSPLKMNALKDVEAVESKLPDIIGLIEKLDLVTKEPKGIYLKAEAVLTHVIGRLRRTVTDDPDLQLRLSNSMTQALQLLDKLKEGEEEEDSELPTEATDGCQEPRAGPSRPQNSILDEPIEQVDTQPMNPFRVPKPKSSSDTPPATRVETITVKKRHIKIEDWGLKFGGDMNGMSVHAFLGEVNLYRKAKHASDEDLFDGAMNFFEGRALLWYKSNIDSMHNWGDIVRKLIEVFEDDDYEAELMHEILNRTQGIEEDFVTYTSVMNMYFARLPTPLGERQKLQILARNVNPYYFERLRMYPRMDDVAGFFKAGLQIEKDKRHIDKYQPPTTTRKGLLEPDLVHQTVRREAKVNAVVLEDASSSRREPRVTREAEARPEPPKPVETEKTPALCWNCKRPGHRFRQCKTLTFPFCPRCGDKEVREGKCAKCRHDQGNFPRGQSS
jgi:hypothetical protein